MQERQAVPRASCNRRHSTDAEAALAVRVVPEAMHHALVIEHQTVVFAGCDGCDAQEVVGYRALPERIATPSVHGTVLSQCQRMASTSRDGYAGRQRGRYCA